MRLQHSYSYQLLAASLSHLLKGALVLALIFCVTARHVSTARAYMSPQPSESLNAYIAGISTRLDARAIDALAKINDTPRKLLALRGYLRSESSLASKWSWSDSEIERYKTTTQYSEAMSEVENVRKKFETLNPGYSLHVNTEVRSLEAQIKSWNQTKSVQIAGEDLLNAAIREISNPPYKTQPDQKTLVSFGRFLKNYKVVSTPTVAVPGLSPHGQLRAFDFQIKQGNRIIAGTNAAEIKDVWDAQGWTDKLRAAVTAASRKFTGPLESPREPWHYTYTP